MKKSIVSIILVFLIPGTNFAQGRFYTKTGKISFFSSTKLEDISAVNRSVISLLDTKTGDIQFAALIKGFEFKKALMQEHFNKDYLESGKYPRSEFKGQITNNNSVNYTTDGVNKVTVKGKLTIHGVTKDVEVPGTITIKNGNLLVNSVFNVLIADHNITLAKVHRDNISKSIRITVEGTLEPVK